MVFDAVLQKNIFLKFTKKWLFTKTNCNESVYLSKHVLFYCFNLYKIYIDSQIDVGPQNDIISNPQSGHLMNGRVFTKEDEKFGRDWITVSFRFVWFAVLGNWPQVMCTCEHMHRSVCPVSDIPLNVTLPLASLALTAHAQQTSEIVAQLKSRLCSQVSMASRPRGVYVIMLIRLCSLFMRCLLRSSLAHLSSSRLVTSLAITRSLL